MQKIGNKIVYNTIVFTGIATEFGVESSARDAFNRGFYSVVRWT
jgi:nicotinamidase-related amidase